MARRGVTLCYESAHIAIYTYMKSTVVPLKHSTRSDDIYIAIFLKAGLGRHHKTCIPFVHY